MRGVVQFLSRQINADASLSLYEGEKVRVIALTTETEAPFLTCFVDSVKLVSGLGGRCSVYILKT